MIAEVRMFVHGQPLLVAEVDVTGRDPTQCVVEPGGEMTAGIVWATLREVLGEMYDGKRMPRAVPGSIDEGLLSAEARERALRGGDGRSEMEDGKGGAE